MKIVGRGEAPDLDALAVIIHKQLSGIEDQLPPHVEAIDLATTLASGCAGYLAHLIYEYAVSEVEPRTIAFACGRKFMEAFAQSFPIYTATEEAMRGPKQ